MRIRFCSNTYKAAKTIDGENLMKMKSLFDNGSTIDNFNSHDSDVLMEICLSITDQSLYDELTGYNEGESRNKFALTALNIGIMALKQAQSRVDTEQVRQEGERLIEKMSDVLFKHQDGVIAQVNTCLKDYFDPNSGHFNERIQRLVGHDGELERVISRQIDGADSGLSKTMSTYVGQDSRLMQILNPDSTNSLIVQLRQSTESALITQREHILRQFSLDNDESALSRLVTELKNNHGDIGKTLQERIDVVTREFSMDRDDSALSRLVKRVEMSQNQINSQFSLDDEGSALARMRKELLDVIEKQSESSSNFQTEVKVALAAMNSRKEAYQRGTYHGMEFESAVFRHIDLWSQNTGATAIATGGMRGNMGNSKVGDVVIELGPENVAAGARIVVEAKQNQTYTYSKALAELDEAKKNRDADVGLFVFSARTTRDNIEPFSRNGNDVVVVWDSEDPNSNVIFNAGLSVAQALSVRVKSHNKEMGQDFVAIEMAVREIQRRVEELNNITSWSNTIRNSNEKVLKSVDKIRESLCTQLEVLDEKIVILRGIIDNNE